MERQFTAEHADHLTLGQLSLTRSDHGALFDVDTNMCFNIYCCAGDKDAIAPLVNIYSLTQDAYNPTDYNQPGQKTEHNLYYVQTLFVGPIVVLDRVTESPTFLQSSNRAQAERKVTYVEHMIDRYVEMMGPFYTYGRKKAPVAYPGIGCLLVHAKQTK